MKKTIATDAIDLGALQISTSDYVSQGNAILGIRDSGKSYTATMIAEQLLLRSIPFVAFDPIGVWRFLRHGGARKGFPLIVAGGEHGDITLEGNNAVSVLEHAMKTGASLVIDLYDIRLSKADWRRTVSDCIRFLLYQNKEHGRRHVFIEEAAEFAPQLLTREYATVYSEVEKLARMGGNAMLGLTLINQRAEQLNKAVLELCDCLVLHRQKGSRSLQALDKWLSMLGEKANPIVQKLPVLEQGECFVFAPGETKGVLTKIPKKLTFHPNRREHVEEGTPVDASKLLAGWTRPVNEHPRDRAAEARAAVQHVVDTKSEVTVIEQPVPVFADGALAKLDAAHRGLSDAVDIAKRTVDELWVMVKKCDALTARKDIPLPKLPPKRTQGGKPTVLAKGPLKILAVLAARHPAWLTQSQVGTLSTFTPSTMRTYLPGLREGALIEETTEGMRITPAGMELASESVEPMPTDGAELLVFWKRKLSQGEGSILQVLHDAAIDGRTFHGRESVMEYLMTQTGFTESTLRTYLPTLRRNELIDKGSIPRISDEFMK